jgi:hypothetical protein
MLYDPLGILFQETEWWVVWLIYALLDIIINVAFCYGFGKTQRVREFFKDPLSILWPFFVLGPIAGGYIFIHKINGDIQIDLQKIGLHYNNYSLGLQNRQAIFLVVALISLALAISTRIRYERYRTNIWFNKPKIFGRVRTILFDYPMSYMALMTIIKLIDQWIVINNFLASEWLPSVPFHADGLYGIFWVYERVTTQIIISLVISIGPLIMIVREGQQKYSWIYKLLFSTGAISILIATLFLANRLSYKINEIYSYYITMYLDSLQIFHDFAQIQDIGFLLHQLLLETQVDRLMKLPNKLIIPQWLEGLIGIRLIFFVFFEIYLNLANKFAWPKISKPLEKLIDRIK